MNNDHEDWLNALAGKATASKPTAVQIEAAAIRVALTNRRNEVEREIGNFNPMKFEDFKKRMTQFGHIAPESNIKSRLKRNTDILISFIAGLISSSALILGLSSHLMVTRSESNDPTINALINLDNALPQETITLESSDPIALIQALESKAWELGLETAAKNSNKTITLTISDMPENDPKASELKLLLGVHPKYKGSIAISIKK